MGSCKDIAWAIGDAAASARSIRSHTCDRARAAVPPALPRPVLRRAGARAFAADRHPLRPRQTGPVAAQRPKGGGDVGDAGVAVVEGRPRLVCADCWIRCDRVEMSTCLRILSHGDKCKYKSAPSTNAA